MVMISRTVFAVVVARAAGDGEEQCLMQAQTQLRPGVGAFVEVGAHVASEVGAGAEAQVRWEPVMRGGELHKDVSEVLSSSNEATQLSPEVRQLLELVAPEADYACSAEERFDQYVMCDQSFAEATGAWSFGVNGYDPWGEHVYHQHQLVPREFDCYNTNPPTTFTSEFLAVCLGDEQDVSAQRDNRAWTTLGEELRNSAAGSALVKMDIEGSEYDVFDSISCEDLRRIGSLTVEYHFNKGCDNVNLGRAMRVLGKVRAQLAVVDAAAGYYSQTNNDCIEGGTELPKLLAVSYRARGTDCPATQ